MKLGDIMEFAEKTKQSLFPPQAAPKPIGGSTQAKPQTMLMKPQLQPGQKPSISQNENGRYFALSEF